MYTYTFLAIFFFFYMKKPLSNILSVQIGYSIFRDPSTTPCDIHDPQANAGGRGINRWWRFQVKLLSDQYSEDQWL